MADNEQMEDDGYIPFKLRFKAWWEGVEIDALRDEPPISDQDDLEQATNIVIDPSSDETKEHNHWPDDRVEFCRRLWGAAQNPKDDHDECVFPGGNLYCLHMAEVMALNGNVALLDLSSGLGGGLRLIVEKYGLWAVGMEPDENLAKKAMALSVEHKLNKNAPITTFDRNALDLPEEKFGGAMMRDLLCSVQNKAEFLKTVHGALRPHGHLVIEDFVLANPDAGDDPAVKSWLAKDDRHPSLSTPKGIKDSIKQLGMNIHSLDDKSDEYRKIILNNWDNFVQSLKREDLTRSLVNNMMVEADFYLRQVRALESGKLRYLRLHASKKGETI